MTQPISKQPEYTLQPDGTIRVWVLAYDTRKDGTGSDLYSTEEAMLDAWFDKLAVIDKDNALRKRWHALHNGEDDEEYTDACDMQEALAGFNDTFNYDEHVLHITR